MCNLYKLDAVAYIQIKLRLPPLEDYIGPSMKVVFGKFVNMQVLLEFVLSDLGQILFWYLAEFADGLWIKFRYVTVSSCGWPIQITQLATYLLWDQTALIISLLRQPFAQLPTRNHTLLLAHTKTQNPNKATYKHQHNKPYGITWTIHNFLSVSIFCLTPRRHLIN